MKFFYNPGTLLNLRAYGIEIPLTDGRILNVLGVKVYFCDPYSSHQRGTNENRIGILRQYFPRKNLSEKSGPGADQEGGVRNE
jgi:hypothetical protein